MTYSKTRSAGNMKFKVQVEIDHLHEFGELITTVHRHRVGALLVLAALVTLSALVALLLLA